LQRHGEERCCVGRNMRCRWLAEQVLGESGNQVINLAFDDFDFLGMDRNTVHRC